MGQTARAKTRGAGTTVPPGARERDRATPVAHRLALASMFVFLAKVGNLPYLGHFGIGKILVGLTILALIFEGGGWAKGVFAHKIMRAYVAMFVVGVLTIPVSVWPGGAAHYVFNSYLKLMVLAILIIVTTTTAADLRRVLWTIVFNTLVLDVVLLHYGLNDINAVNLGKNGIAMTSVISFGLLLGVRTRRLGTLLKMGASALLIYTVLMSVSRGSYIGLALVVLLYSYLRYGMKAILAPILIAALAVLAYRAGPTPVHHTMNTLLHIQRDYNFTSQTGRIAIWKRGLALIKSHPLGVGMRNFQIAEGHLVENVIGERWMDAHNALLQATAELGIIGGLVFLALLKRAMQTANRLRAMDKLREFANFSNIGLSAVLAVFGYFVTAFFLSKAYTAILYILIAMIVSADRIYARKQGSDVDVIPGKGT